jgi:hypothetical protein
MTIIDISSTKRRRDNGDTPFGAWMRLHPELDSRRVQIDIENLDYAPFLYVRGYLRILEEKQGYQNFPNFAQRDTHGVIDQALRFALSHPEFLAERMSPNRTKQITYGGYHLIQFERTNPADGGVRLNGMPIDDQHLLHFLQGCWEPDIQWEHLKKCQELLENIMESKTAQDLRSIAKRIKSSNDYNELELSLMRSIFDEQVQKVKVAS